MINLPFHKTLRLICLIAFGWFHQSSFAVTEYLLPTPLIDNDIEYLITVADIPAMNKPYPIALIKAGLVRIETSYPDLHHRIQAYLTVQNDTALKRASLEATVARNSAHKVMPLSHGQTSDADYRADIVAWAPLTSFAAISLGGEYGNHRNKNAQPTNSFLSLGTGYFQADLGYRDHWYSPGHLGSLLISTQAPLSPSVTFSNYKPWWGIRYEIFYSQLEQVEGIRTDSGLTSGDPGLLGMQLSLQPIPWFSVSLNRMLMFSGGERAATLGDIWQGIIDPVSKDNTGSAGFDSDQENNELGNQLAAISTAFNFNPGLPMRLYFSYAGEDAAGHTNYKLSNLGALAGVYFPRIMNRLSFRYELNEWQSAWYVHHLYQNGYTNSGNIMGHWFGAERVFGDGLGGRSHALQLTYRQLNKALIGTTIRQLTNDSYSKNDYVTGQEVELNYQRPLSNKLSAGATLYAGRSVMSSSFYNLRLTLRWL